MASITTKPTPTKVPNTKRRLRWYHVSFVSIDTEESLVRSPVNGSLLCRRSSPTIRPDNAFLPVVHEACSLQSVFFCRATRCSIRGRALGIEFCK